MGPAERIVEVSAVPRINQGCAARCITDSVRGLRCALSLTQQEFAVRMESAVSTVVRYEHGSRPNVQALAKMWALANEAGLDALAAAFRLYVSVSLYLPHPHSDLFVLIWQDPKRRAELIKFAAPEIEQLRKEGWKV